MKGDKDFQLALGTIMDEDKGPLVLMDFGTVAIDHLKLTPEQALQMAEGLVETAREAAAGRRIITSKRFERPS